MKMCFLFNLSLARLRKLIQCLCMVLFILLVGLASVVHRTVVFRAPTAAFITSYNLGKVVSRPSHKMKSFNLYQGSALQTYYSKILILKCNAKERSLTFVNNSGEFWIPIEDGFKTNIRPKSFLDIRRVSDGINFRSVKVLATSQRRNLTGSIFCSFHKTNTELISLQAKSAEIFLPQWNPNATSGQLEI